MSDVVRRKWRRPARLARSLSSAVATVVVIGMISACGMITIVEDPRASATVESRKKTCAIERKTIDVANFTYTTKKGQHAASMNELIREGYLVSVVGHQLTQEGEVLANRFCDFSSTPAASGTGGSSELTLAEVGELMELAKAIYRSVIGDDTAGVEPVPTDEQTLCLANALNNSIGKDRMKAVSTSLITMRTTDRDAVRAALNGCDPAENAGLVLMTSVYTAVGQGLPRPLPPTPAAIQCTVDHIRGKVGDVLLVSFGTDDKTARSYMGRLMMDCFPKESLVEMVSGFLKVAGATQSVANCAATKVVDRVTFAYYVDNILTSELASPAFEQKVESEVSTAVRECM